MSELITVLFENFSTTITGLAGGLKEAFVNLIYVDPSAAQPAFSPLVIFGFTMAGLTLAAGILYKIFGVIRSRR